MTLLLFLTACSGAPSFTSMSPQATLRGDTASIVAKVPVLKLDQTSADFIQSPLYSPGGSECYASTFVSCANGGQFPPNLSLIPRESDGYQGPWTLSSSNSSVATAANCVSFSQLPCSYPGVGVGIYGYAPGSAIVTIGGDNGASTTFSMTVTETTFKIRLANLPNASELDVYVDATTCGYRGLPEAIARFPRLNTNDALITIENVPYPACDGVSVFITIGDGVNTLASKVIAATSKKPITLGASNTLHFYISPRVNDAPKRSSSEAIDSRELNVTSQGDSSIFSM